MFPIPGARVASPQTQIAFRGVPIGEVGKIVVTGSRSGVHAGRFESDSDRDGGSFLPTKPFVSGEVVTVRTSLHILGAEHFRNVPLHGRHAVGIGSGDPAGAGEPGCPETCSRSTRGLT